MVYNCLVEVFRDGHLYLQSKEFYSEINDKKELERLIKDLKHHYNADRIHMYKLSSIY
jgi:hypothetical protein